MSETPPRTLGRRLFDGLTAATMGVFALFCAAILLCAAKVPQLREMAEERRLARFTRTSVQYQQLHYAEDDSALKFTVVENYVETNGREIERRIAKRSVPTGRRTPLPAPHDTRQSLLTLREILKRYRLGSEMLFELAVSHDHRELAFTSGGVIRRDPAGTYSCVSGEPLPPAIERLALHPGTLESPDPQQWADAAIGSVLQRGADPAVFADRLLAPHEQFETDALVEILLKLETRPALDQVARVALQRKALQRRLIHGALNRPRFLEPPDDEPAPPDPAVVRLALLECVASAEWRDPGEFVVDWTLTAFEDGAFARLGAVERRRLLERLLRHVELRDVERLARVVGDAGDVEAVGAWVLLRKLAGEPTELDAGPEKAREAREWVEGRRKRRLKPFDS